MARKISGGHVVAEINVTPMADVMLVLLIIFMITTPLLQANVALNLPNARNPLDAPDANSNEAVVISLNKAGQIYRAKTALTDEGLYDFLRKHFAESEVQGRTIYLRADTSISYGRVVEIVNGCRDAGVDRIGLMTDKDESR